MKTMNKRDIEAVIIILGYYMHKEAYQELYKKLESMTKEAKDNLLSKWEKYGFVDAKDFCLWYGY